jgi:cold shock CspA family protein
MIGRVVAPANRPDYCFIQDENDQDHFCHVSEMPVNSIGQCYLKPGEIVKFELKTMPSRTLPVCAHVVLLSQRPPIPADYREVGEVVWVSKGGGLCDLRRDMFNRQVELHRHGVRAEFSPIDFKIGQLWGYSIVPPKRHPRISRWHAIDAVLISENVKSENK